MPDPDRRCDVLFDRFDRWRDEMRALRSILLTSPLTEAFKWRAPVYTWDGGNVAILWGFAEAATLGFFKGVLLDDPEGLLEPPGPASRAVRVMKFRSLSEISAREAALRKTIARAVEIENAGLKVELPKDDMVYPQELVDRMDTDPDLAAAFEALTPGRKRGYCLYIGAAKQSATRAARIEKHFPRILAGKGVHDR